MGDSDGHFKVHATIFRIDPELLDPSINPPTVDPSKYLVLDDDGKVCAWIGEDELHASYVDENISKFKLSGIQPFTEAPNPDVFDVNLTYSNGKQLAIRVGSISLDDGPAPDHYYKTGGFIYPVASDGTALLDDTNTPNLAYIRQTFWDLAKQAVATNLMFAEMVNQFAGAIAQLGHAGELSNSMTTSPSN